VEIQRYYAAMRREIERLSLMIDDLFELAQMDAGALRLDKRVIALQEVASEVVDAMQAQARRQAIGLSLKINGRPPELLVDGGRVERAISNLLRNALEHTPEGGRIGVAVAADNGCVEISVSDTGAGIDEGDLPHIWGRFYRAEKARNRRIGSNGRAGLGLSLASGIGK